MRTSYSHNKYYRVACGGTCKNFYDFVPATVAEATPTTAVDAGPDSETFDSTFGSDFVTTGDDALGASLCTSTLPRRYAPSSTERRWVKMSPSTTADLRNSVRSLARIFPSTLP